ncbi:MAG: hypothetical protein ACK53L_05975, partial [Pirellulaceae bacterium]
PLRSRCIPVLGCSWFVMVSRYRSQPLCWPYSFKLLNARNQETPNYYACPVPLIEINLIPG